MSVKEIAIIEHYDGDYVWTVRLNTQIDKPHTNVPPPFIDHPFYIQETESETEAVKKLAKIIIRRYEEEINDLHYKIEKLMKLYKKPKEYWIRKE